MLQEFATSYKTESPVGLGCRIHRLHLCRGPRPSRSSWYPGYDTKPSNGEAPVLELWAMRSTPSLPLLPGPFCPGVVALDSVLFIGQIELFDHINCV